MPQFAQDIAVYDLVCAEHLKFKGFFVKAMILQLRSVDETDPSQTDCVFHMTANKV